MESKSVDDICELLEERGFPDTVICSFKGKMMSISACIEDFTMSCKFYVMVYHRE